MSWLYLFTDKRSAQETDQTFEENEKKKTEVKLKSERLAAIRSLKSNIVLTLLFILSNLFLLVPNFLINILQNKTTRAFLPLTII